MDISAYAPPSGTPVVEKSDDASALMDIKDIDQFLTLFVEQLKNQDPLSPMENTEFLAQTAQLTSVEQLMKINENSKDTIAAISALGMNTAASLLGKQIAADVTSPEGDTNQVIGQVVEVIYDESGEPILGLDTGEFAKLSEITNITQL
jgi:flagellar basal-body rod modification protein FlgD